MNKMRVTVAFAAVAAMSLATVACGGKSADAPPKENFPALGQAAKLTVMGGEKAVDGARALRWKPVKGVSEKLSMTMDTKMEIEVSGKSMPMTMTMKMDMDGEIQEVKEDGSAIIAMVVQDASLDMPGMEGAGDMLKDMMKGLTITTTMDPRGATTDTKVTGGGAMMEQLGDQMNNSLDQMAIPFPEEPVGVGSKWQALTTQEANGMKVRMVAVYELVELDGDKGKVKLTIQQFADAQKMDMQGMKADLKGLKSDGSGEMSFDLTRPMFAKASLNLKMDAEIAVMGENAEMKIDARVGMAPR